MMFGEGALAPTKPPAPANANGLVHCAWTSDGNPFAFPLSLPAAATISVWGALAAILRRRSPCVCETECALAGQ